MIGWRARLGFLVPPGNPTVETEMIELAPRGVMPVQEIAWLRRAELNADRVLECAQLGVALQIHPLEVGLAVGTGVQA